jgi:hypothetical protein
MISTISPFRMMKTFLFIFIFLTFGTSFAAPTSIIITDAIQSAKNFILKRENGVQEAVSTVQLEEIGKCIAISNFIAAQQIRFKVPFEESTVFGVAIIVASNFIYRDQLIAKGLPVSHIDNDIKIAGSVMLANPIAYYTNYSSFCAEMGLKMPSFK